MARRYKRTEEPNRAWKVMQITDLRKELDLFTKSLTAYIHTTVEEAIELEKAILVLKSCEEKRRHETRDKRPRRGKKNDPVSEMSATGGEGSASPG